jgi:hypothetical protein
VHDKTTLVQRRRPIKATTHTLALCLYRWRDQILVPDDETLVRKEASLVPDKATMMHEEQLWCQTRQLWCKS